MIVSAKAVVRLAASPSAPYAGPVRVACKGAFLLYWAAAPPHQRLQAPGPVPGAVALEAAELQEELGGASRPACHCKYRPSPRLRTELGFLPEGGSESKASGGACRRQGQLLRGRSGKHGQKNLPGCHPLERPRGICLSRYFEQFGGFGQTRDLALIAVQVAMAMDAMQAGRLELAQDHLALLAVSLEQASLDGGRMDLAYQLAWLEEPPAGMYANRTALLQASAG